MARAESSFGAVSALGTSYTLLATVPSATTWNLHLHIANRVSTTVKVRVFIADTSWTSGEPTGGTLVAAIAYDLAINSGEIVQITGIVMTATDELVVYSDTASSVDIIASGVAIT